MSILEIINQIEADKKKRNIYPSHAVFREIEKAAADHYPIGAQEIVAEELKELVKQNAITIGDTINDNYVTVL